jgi:antitoxin component of RelBE/YafQ-DinJ toxin-antitoxin module
MSALTVKLISTSEFRYEKPRIVTFKITPGELEKIDKLALKLGLTRSEVIRLALSQFIQNNYDFL